MNTNISRLVIAVAVLVLLGVPAATPSASDSKSSGSYIQAESYGHITDVPYVWQEFNGFCYWASVDMAMQYNDIDYDLYQFFAATGMGFSAAYLMIEDLQIFASGTSFQQQAFLPVIDEVFGVHHEAYFDENSEWIKLVEPLWTGAGVNLELVDGFDAALAQLYSIIDSGQPSVLWVDPYWLPTDDYVVLRQFSIPQDPAAPSQGHAVLVIGYNDTSNTVEVMDPFPGAIGDGYGYPGDDRYNYVMNISTLERVWAPLGYGQVVFTPRSTPVQDQEERIGRHVVNRLMGNRTLYNPDLEGVFFASFGEAAFRGFGLDTTVECISSYLDEYESTEEKVLALMLTGYSAETMLTREYIAYRGALESLSSVMPSYDLSAVLQSGRKAYSHMEALSSNESLIDIFYEGGGSRLTSTYFSIAESYENSGDLDAALEEHSTELEEISEQLIGIADVWKETAEKMDALLDSNNGVPVLLIASGCVFMAAIVCLVFRRRGK